MMNTDVMFSSKTDDWETPQDLFDKLDQEFEFNLDVCATRDNRKCRNFYAKELDGLKQDWHGVCWMNPPYGREIGKWVQKAYEESLRGSTVVCLLPSRTDTRWWHDYCMKGEVRFIKGRLKFGNSKNSAPFPSAIVIFRGDSKGVEEGEPMRIDFDAYRQKKCQTCDKNAGRQIGGREKYE